VDLGKELRMAKIERVEFIDDVDDVDDVDGKPIDPAAFTPNEFAQLIEAHQSAHRCV